MRNKGGLRIQRKKFEENKPTFTIVTVVYNAEDMIEDTILSILEQDYLNKEYIIIDGASTDSTLNIVKKYENEIDYWLSEKDSGIYSAMNKGINLSEGDYICFMNAGDKFTDKNVLSNIANNINLDCDVIYGDRNYIKGNKKTFQKARSVDTIYERMPFGHQSTFTKTNVLKKYMFNTTYLFAADYNLFLQLYLKDYKFQYLNITVCDFLSGGESESGVRPYLEAIKILLDNVKDPLLIKKNAYLIAFKKTSNKLLSQYLD